MCQARPVPPDIDEPRHLHVEVRPGRGPYALFVHGMLTSRALWEPNLEALSTVCRPVVVELLGHGRSPAPQQEQPYLPSSYVSEFERIRSSLGADRWIVVGQSLGGALTMRYALDHPERVTAHVFTNSASALGDEAWQAEIARTIPVVAARIESTGRDAVAALPQHPARGRRLPGKVKQALVDDAEMLDPGGVARTLRCTIPSSSCRSRAKENAVPTLLVVGNRERSFAGPRQYVESAMPHLTVVDVDAGHAVNIQAASAFNDAVQRFLGDVVADDV